MPIVYVSREIQRPNDTNLYAAKDVWDISASALGFRFTNAGRTINNGGYIVSAQAFTDDKTMTCRIRLHLYNSAPSPIPVDNAPFAALYSNIDRRIGFIDFPAFQTEDTTSTMAHSEVIGTTPLPMAFNVTDGTLIGIVEQLDSYTPIANKKMTIILGIDQL